MTGCGGAGAGVTSQGIYVEFVYGNARGYGNH